MKHSLTQFAASVLVAISEKPQSTATALSVLFFAPMRDMVETLNFLESLSLVNEKQEYYLLDGKHYSITELGTIALEQYKAERGSKPLPPFVVR